MTSADNEKNERGEPDWGYLEGRPGRDVNIPNSFNARITIEFD